ncbi:MAG: CPBP family intramembrane metalloprotease [Kiritimatiellae bacterium]|nr:CPBP family intramembrane metalloprotease [Kiritimatiellia bacterium]
MNTTSRKALWRLLLLVPAPSLGVCAGMIWWPDTAFGKAIFFAMKIWLLAFPLVCFLWLDRERRSASPMRQGGALVGAALGVAISAFIFGVYALVGDRLIDPAMIQARMQAVGLDTVLAYLIGAAYWVTINSLLEEYVWRWFVVRQCEQLSRRPIIAILVSALGFTIHHIVAMQLFMSWTGVAFSALGIFVGGAIWSACYVRYRSIWPGYISHAIVDIAVFGIGYRLIFL